MEARNANNTKYWEDRALRLKTRVLKDSEQIEKEIVKEYNKASELIQREINHAVAKYGKDHKLTWADAKREIDLVDLEIYTEKLDELKNALEFDNTKVLQRELAKLELARDTSILEWQLKEIELQITKVTAKVDKTLADHLSDIYDDVYYRTIFDLQQGTGLGASFVQLDPNMVYEAVTYPWSGSNYSDLLWKNKEYLNQKVRETVTSGIIRGAGIDTLAAELHLSMGSEKYKSERIIRTETAEIYGRARNQGLKESGLTEKYIFVARLDLKTSKICQGLDGKSFNLEDREPGVNASPMHPNCRSTERPDINTKDLERVAKDGAGKYYKVPGNMTYKEWYDKFHAAPTGQGPAKG